jgi:hypothetical protein
MAEGGRRLTVVKDLEAVVLQHPSVFAALRRDELRPLTTT